MTYRIDVKPSAAKELRRLDRDDRADVEAAIDALATTPRPAGCKAMKGEWKGAYRIRVGKDLRVIYEVHDAVLVVLVVKIGGRGDVYR